MSNRKWVAQGLADAMLAGPADAASCRERCAHALQPRPRPRWLRYLVQKVLRRHKHEWHDGARDRLAATIADYHTALPPMRVFALRSGQPPPRPASLEGLELPLLGDLKDVADWLELTMDGLLAFTRTRRGGPEHYVIREIQKRTVGTRLLEIPKARLKAVQRSVLHGLLDRVPCHSAAHGFLPDRSILTQARLHVAQPVVVNLDLKDFFHSVRKSRVVGLFLMLGFRRAPARALAALCTTRHLPQGAPTSPALANLAAFNLDIRLTALARSLQATYTRYADDLTFSGDRRLAGSLGWLPSQVDVIAQEEGFRVNHRKTMVMRRSRRQQVTGVVVNAHPNFSRTDFDRLKAILTNCRRHGPQSQNREAHPDFRAHLRGRVSHAVHLNPARGERLLALFQQIDWEMATTSE